jgi:hypothetical protein
MPLIVNNLVPSDASPPQAKVAQSTQPPKPKGRGLAKSFASFRPNSQTSEELHKDELYQMGFEMVHSGEVLNYQEDAEYFKTGKCPQTTQGFAQSNLSTSKSLVRRGFRGNDCASQPQNSLKAIFEF